MENGLPTSATLSIRRTGAQVYDLVTHRQVTSLQATEDQTMFQVELGPCEGRVFMVTDQAIDHVRIESPDSAAVGQQVTVQVAVLGDDGQRMRAVVPVRIDVLDPSGKSAEFSGYYGAKDGIAKLALDIAPNDSPGLWRIHVQELASGLAADAYFRVQLDSER